MIERKIAAVDIGYGETKMAWLISDGPVHRSFRSIVELANPQDLDSYTLNRRKTVRVVVNGVEYEVGNDANKMAARPNEGVLHDDYVGTPEWMALAKAALATIGAEKISHLVSGLPMMHFDPVAIERVRSRLTGVHEHCGPLTVEVGKVSVLPQPLGGLMDFKKQAAWEIAGRLSKQGVFIIDPGAYTTDYLLTLQGQAAPKRSGSTPHGMAEVVAITRAAIVRQHGGAPDVHTISEALKNRETTVFAAGTEVKLAPYVTRALTTVGGAILRDIRNTVKSFEDIDTVIMVGGGAAMFRPIIADGLPVPAVHLASYPAFANVRGYLEYGESVV